MSILGIISLCVSSFGIGFFVAAALYDKPIHLIWCIIGAIGLLYPIHEISSNSKDEDVKVDKVHYIEKESIDIQDKDTINEAFKLKI